MPDEEPTAPARVTVVDAADAEHRFAVTGPHEDYRPVEDAATGELQVLRETYATRPGSSRALTGCQVVAAWPPGTWRDATLHADPPPDPLAADEDVSDPGPGPAAG